MNVIITAGGTSEKIDSVRSISNISTGALGSLVADAFAILPDIRDIYYVCSKTAILPQSKKVTALFVDSVTSLEKMIIEVFDKTNIDIIIHCMAVSDYRVRSITSVSSLACSCVAQKDMLSKIDEKTATSTIEMLLNNSAPIIDGRGKIKSNVDDMLMLMERTPKVISLYQKISPQSLLVGFKLMDSVSHETLIDTAFHLLQANKCTFVLANDLKEINNNSHIGYLIDSSKGYQQFTTKKEIANGIAKATMEKRRKT